MGVACVNGERRELVGKWGGGGDLGGSGGVRKGEGST